MSLRGPSRRWQGGGDPRARWRVRSTPRRPARAPPLSATDDFYARLPPLARFADLVRPDAYAAVPDDWSVVVADVVGSTEAVAAGRYRDVNYVGAGAIAAVLNAVGHTDVPFVFGGDGATLLLAPGVRDRALGALVALRADARARLGLDLRVGAVRVADVRAAGHDVRLARVEVAPAYAQALLAGDGLAFAEAQIKSDPARFAPNLPPTDDADLYAGLECRWHDVASPRGETVALLVQAAGDPGGPGQAAEATYTDVLETIERIYGPDDAHHPISVDHLRLRAAPATTAEARLRARSWRDRLVLIGQGLIGRVLLWRGRPTSETDWARYPHLLRAATDVRKFDGALRMILAGTPDQREALEAWLEEAFVAGRLAWGTHAARAAVLTCLVYERMGRQVHFVDAAGGGYTQAAVGFKARLKALADA